MAHAIIIANGTVLTCDAANRCGRLHIVVSNGRFLNISDNLDRLRSEHPQAELFDAKGMLIVPGFVNAHYHGESFLLRATTEGFHFSLWKDEGPLQQAATRLLHKSSYEDVRTLYRAAYGAHLLSGTTCVGEFPPDVDENAFGYMLQGIEPSGIIPVITLQNWEHIGAVRSLHEKRPRVAVNMGKENDFTVYSIEKLSQAAKELRAPLLAHVAEQRDDVEIVRKNFQKDILTLLNSFNAIRQSTILIHANHCSDSEAAIVKEANGTVIVCARSTALKQTGYPALRHLAKRHVRLAMGTDWGDVDMPAEMRFISQLPLVVPGLRLFSSLEILRMATINGAYALGLSAETGSIEPGKRADAVLFNAEDIRLPLTTATSSAESVASIVVNHLSTGDIHTVMMNGTFAERSTSNREHFAAFSATARKFFSEKVLSRPQTHEHTTELARNVLPFSSEARSQQEENEGFEEGFPASARTTRVVGMAEPANPLVNRPKPQREPIRPELPKDTRRVFGEDDDV
ncbi:MAG: amidohydrolase family protein [Bacteroidetes bacterium]|nr:amidohydrolase family protein [Bacteroidota bacterium]MCW5894732.1 amidohydrolase family protein [Bacteroidota bacterium]